jgi:precorrin-6B methylase 2
VTARRGPSFSIDEALADPGFTPRAGDVSALLDRVAAGGDLGRAAGAALLRIQSSIAEQLAARLSPGAATSLVELAAPVALRAVGSASDVDRLAAALCDLLAPGGPTAERRAAANALGKMLGASAVRDALGEAGIDRCAAALMRALGDDGGDPAARRVTARALAAAGTAAARRALEGLDPAADAAIARAQLLSRRDAARAAGPAAPPRLEARAGGVVFARLACRRGLEPIVVTQLGPGRRSHVTRPGRVDLELDEPPEAALAAARSALSIAFPLAPVAVASCEVDEIASAVERALTSPQAGRVLDAFARPPLRFRIAFADGRKHRALAWGIAERMDRGGRFQNDTRDAPWEVVVGLPPDDERGTATAARRFLTVELRPRVEDTRFPWRAADVPAASHPTVAAAIAHVGGAREDDVVWDPFVGSAGELCERWRLGPAARLVGTDVDEDALAAAARNLAAAGAPAELVRTDARDHAPSPRATLILSNPPMGRRVLRSEGDARGVLVEVMARTRTTLAPGGRLVWTSAHPEDTRAAGRAAGLRLSEAWIVDLGGFDVELQRFDKPS